MDSLSKKPIEYVLRLLKIRDRSTGEIRAKMRQKGFLDEEIGATIAWLNEHDFLDDKKFARLFVKNQLALKPQGKFALRMRLRRLHVADDLISETLAAISGPAERSLALETAERWLARKSSDPAKVFEKLSRYLVSRGFSWDTTKSVIDEVIKSE